jgi:hypothetical protein
MVDLDRSLPDHCAKRITMARRRLIAERPLTSTERWRRYRDRLRGIEVPDAPGAMTAVSYLEAMFPGYRLPTWDDVIAAASDVAVREEDAA